MEARKGIGKGVVYEVDSRALFQESACEARYRNHFDSRQCRSRLSHRPLHVIPWGTNLLAREAVGLAWERVLGGLPPQVGEVDKAVQE